MRYRNYIASHAWRSSPVRLAELAASRGRCRLCFARASVACRLEVHHATYRRLGREARGDLVALCGACHREVESFLRRRRFSVRRAIRADVQCMRDVRTSLFDPTR